jgi:hypothetical protein
MLPSLETRLRMEQRMLNPVGHTVALAGRTVRTPRRPVPSRRRKGWDTSSMLQEQVWDDWESLVGDVNIE